MFLGENPISDLSLHVLWAPVLCVMGGRQWFLGHVCLSYTCTVSSAQCYGIRASQGQERSNELTARTLLIPCINTLGLTTRLFFIANASKPPEHAYVVYLQHLYKYTNVCLGPRASNSLSSCPIQVPPYSGYCARPSPYTSPNRSTSPASLFAASSTSSFSYSSFIALIPLANLASIALRLIVG